jgi:predicted DNA-binding ArsR family transcriptional regulator
VNEAIVTEYVELCAQLSALDVETEERFYARLDTIWYTEMSAEDRAAAESRLTALGNGDRAWHDDRRKENP